MSLRPCGTIAAYERHLRNGEPPCVACRKATSEYRKKRRAYQAAYQRAVSRLIATHRAEFATFLTEERQP